MLIVIKSTIVERVKVFDHNIFDKLRFEYEVDGFRKDIESAKGVFSFELTINRIDFLDKMNADSDFPEISQRKNGPLMNHFSVTEIWIFLSDCLHNPDKETRAKYQKQWWHLYDM